MKLGIMGLVGSGRSTIFEALTRTAGPETRKVEDRIASVKVPDQRVDALVAMYKPAKTAYANSHETPAAGKQAPMVDLTETIKT